MARLVVEIEQEQHRHLKMCCARLGKTIKDFCLEAIIAKVDLEENGWAEKMRLLPMVSQPAVDFLTYVKN